MTTENYSKQWFNDGYSPFKDRASMNATCRTIYNTHPIVNSIINSHSDIPLNYLHIDLPENTTASKFFDEQIDTINLQSKIQYILQGYWLFGESFLYAELDEKKGAWSNLTIQNPDYVIVKRSSISSDSQYFLRPDENLRRLVFSGAEQDKVAVKQLNESIVTCIKNGNNIPLDSFFLSHIVRKVSPYEIRGTGLLAPVLKTILSDNKSEEITTQSIRLCLMDPFLNENVNMEKIKSSYRNLFTGLEQWAKKKLFAPVAKIQNFYELKDGEKTLITPRLYFDLDGLMAALKE